MTSKSFNRRNVNIIILVSLGLCLKYLCKFLFDQNAHAANYCWLLRMLAARPLQQMWPSIHYFLLLLSHLLSQHLDWDTGVIKLCLESSFGISVISCLRILRLQSAPANETKLHKTSQNENLPIKFGSSFLIGVEVSSRIVALKAATFLPCFCFTC